MNSTKNTVVGGALALVLASGGFAIAVNSGPAGGSTVGDLSPASSTGETPSPSTSTSTIVVDVPVSSAPGDDSSVENLSDDSNSGESNSGQNNSGRPRVTRSPAPGTGASAATLPAQPSESTTSPSRGDDPRDDASEDASDDHSDDPSDDHSDDPSEDHSEDHSEDPSDDRGGEDDD